MRWLKKLAMRLFNLHEVKEGTCVAIMQLHGITYTLGVDFSVWPTKEERAIKALFYSAETCWKEHGGMFPLAELK